MNEDENALMAKFGITCEQKKVYCYKQHRYEKLEQAIEFAKIDTERDRKINGQPKTEN